MSLPRTLADLRPHPNNPRSITAAAAKGLRASLREFGDLSGVVVNMQTGRLVCGHQRRDALLTLAAAGIEWEPTQHETQHGAEQWGWLETPSGERWRVRAVWWDEGREALANLAANNRAIEGDFTSAVADLAREAKAADEFLFEELLLADLLPKARKEGGPSQTFAGEATTRLGDIWACGRHLVVCADGLEDATLTALGLDVEPPDAILADPPYGIGEKTKRGIAGRGKVVRSKDFPPIVGDDSTATAERAVALCGRWPKALKVFWGANHYAAVAHLSDTSSWICWDKTGGGGVVDDNADGELAWTSRGGPMRIWSHLWKGICKASESGELRGHATQKPVELYVWLIQAYPRKPVARLYDPFGGSGSSLVAAEQTGATARVAELVPHYVDVIVRRWADATGATPTLVTR